jgi:signal transduction histidine kinase
MSDSNPARDLFTRLVNLCADFQYDTGIECAVWLDPAHLQLSPDADDVVYRAVRELLENVRRHAHATSVKVTSERRRGGAVAINVIDNGVGLPPVDKRPNPVRGGAFGLWSIEHRLTDIGGTLELESRNGLRATLVIPS